MKFNPSYLLIPFMAISLWQCDKIEDPFPIDNSISDTNIVWDDSVFSATNNDIRYVLMEEFTGHLCTNCPDAAREITRLHDKQYHEKFIAIAIHATEGFAAPHPNYEGAPTGSYLTDHRAEPESDDYEAVDYFGVKLGLPRGMVNRTLLKNSSSTSAGTTRDKWKAQCDDIYNNPGPTVANLNIVNFFDDSSKTFQVRIDIDWLQAHNEDLMLQVQLLEDSIVDWQLDNGVHVPDYMHRHMFKESVNGTFGEAMPLASSGTTTRITYTRQFDAEGEGYHKDKCIIVAYLYKKSPEWEVMQVNEAHLTKGH